MSQKMCIVCEAPIKELYRTAYSSNVIKISNCVYCKNTADKYVEFEKIIIFIDLILLQRPAYRHVLHNTDFLKFWKFSIVLVFIEAYFRWVNNVGADLKTNDSSKIPNDEKGFYIFCLWIVLENFLMFGCVYGYLKVRRTTQPNAGLLWKAITLANLSKLLCLPIMVWGKNLSILEIQINNTLIEGYYLLTLICAYSVVLRLSKLHALFIVLSALFLKALLLNGSN